VSEQAEKKVVLVTGGNRGIGKAIVAAILDAGPEMHVWLGSRSKARGEEAMREILAGDPSREGRLRVVELDVSSDASCERAAEVLAEDAPLYGIVNNAGIGSEHGLESVIQVNTLGPKRVVDAMMPLLKQDGGRIVNVSSASGPNFVAECDDALTERLTRAEVTWADIERTLQEARTDLDSMGNGTSYGLSKACLNAYTIELAREHPTLTVNACTPGFIETDMTRKWAVQRNATPEEMGMKQPADGAKAPVFLLLGDPGGSGWYFGSDAVRSPLDRYRSPGDPAYDGT